MTKKLHLSLGCLAIATLSLLASCRTVPITGRSQFILTSLANEKATGLAAFTEYKKKYPRSTNSKYNAALTSCATAIIKATEYTGYDWEYTVFQSAEQNAFCLPGGKVAVYSGLIDLMNNEAELAFVVAHEIAHAVARHGGERTSWGTLQKFGSMAVSKKGKSATDIYQKATQLGVILPFSRSNEYEADKIGMILMAKAGYNPDAAIGFWSRFTNGGQNESLLNGLMSTHPRDGDRIQAMRNNLPEARAAYAKAIKKRGYGMAL